jgi:hypothetical protein
MRLHEFQYKYNERPSSELEVYCRRESLDPINMKRASKKEKRQAEAK